MTKLFGTDGVRGLANRHLTGDLAYKLGRAIGYRLGFSGNKKGILIGKDTRISGDMLEAALVAGICSTGVDAYCVGTLPTPGVAYLTKELGKSAGAVISASHNPFADNGIKFFDSQGMKLSDELEKEIEKLISKEKDLPYPIGKDIGRVYHLKDSYSLYADYLKSHFKGSLDGLKIVLDCSHGATYKIAPGIFQELGAQVKALFTEPNGININQACGSTHLEALQEKVLEEGADLGFAFDGDGDRVLAVDEQGRTIDGDQLLVISALALKEQNKLPGNRLVVTVMSNLGLHKALEDAGIEVIITQVGDRYVLEKMMETGAILGGEQSGHIIFLNQNTTGDGLATALNILQFLVVKQKPLSVLAEQMERYPQKMKNILVKDKHEILQRNEILTKISEIEKKLGKRGRVLVRPSGTESLIRIMVEGSDKQELQEIIDELASLIKAYD